MEFARTRTFRIAVLAAAVCGVIACGIWRCGGLRLPGVFAPAHHIRKKAPDVLQPAVDAYNKRDYAKAEAEAWRIVDAARGSDDVKVRKNAVQARYVIAFAAARQKKMKLARDRFSTLKREAAALPDKGAQPTIPGQVQPTLEEEAATRQRVGVRKLDFALSCERAQGVHGGA